MLNKSKNDVEFNEIIKKIHKTTIVDNDRCYMLYQFSKHLSNMNNDVAEVGVYKGGTAQLISSIFRNNIIHLFDTFEGMPETDEEKDLHKKGDFKDVSFEQVKNNLSDYKNVSFYKGFFPDTATSIENRKFCFVHIDADIYKSVCDCCKFFYDRLVSGAIMVFDDYGFPSCPGAKQAVDEFFVDKKEQIIYLSTGQCFIIKL